MSFDKIESICNELGIDNYVINNDNSVDVAGTVDISEKELVNIPIKFGVVTGNFICSNNKLTSLKNIPNRCDNILCDNNCLEYLDLTDICCNMIWHDIEIYNKLSFAFDLKDNVKIQVMELNENNFKQIKRINTIKRILKSE